jgi:hypothetical protein
MDRDHGQRPNLWALSLMELMAEKLSLRSEELDHAYRQCIVALDRARRGRHLRLVRREERPPRRG